MSENNFIFMEEFPAVTKQINVICNFHEQLGPLRSTCLTFWLLLLL